jgi:hypothetical protein
MIAQAFFDWNGPRDTVKEYGKKLEKACKKTGAKFHGIYNPPQDKWNFVAVFEAKGMDKVRETFGEAGGMPEKMGHIILKYYFKAYP